MDQNFLAEQKKKLQAQAEQVGADLTVFALKTKGPGGFTARYPNVGDEVEDNVFEMATQEEQADAEKNLEELLERTKAAIKRINDSSYGRCLSCGREIELERLKAAPEAEECLECVKV